MVGFCFCCSRFGKKPLGSKTSRLWKCNAPQSSRFPRSRHIVPSERKYRIHKTLIFTKLRTAQISKCLPCSNPRGVLLLLTLQLFPYRLYIQIHPKFIFCFGLRYFWIVVSDCFYCGTNLVFQFWISFYNPICYKKYPA